MHLKSSGKLNYALVNGRAVHISRIGECPDAEYVCPACGETLEVKNGEDGSLYFAHRSGRSCGYERELSLRTDLKEWLSRRGRITIPAVYIEFSTQKAPVLLSEAKTVDIDRTELVNVSDDVLPDIMLFSGGKRMLVIVPPEGRLCREAVERVVSSGVSAIEIHPGPSEDWLWDDDGLPWEQSEKRWIFNAAAEKCLDRFMEVCDRRRVVLRGTELVVYGCPLKSQPSNGGRCADYITDCFACQYFIDRVLVYQPVYYDPRSHTSKEYILCSGKNRISTLEDLEKYRLKHH